MGNSIRPVPIVETEGEKTNPLDAALLADTGAIAQGGIWEGWVIVGASAAADIEIQCRNAANDDAADDGCVIKVPASQSGTYPFIYSVPAGGRIRVVMDDALTGTISATIYAKKQMY